MEIIMKVKCSPSPGDGSSPHSTLKIVDHHHQLQQHTFMNAGYKTSPSPNNVISPRTYTPNTHQAAGKYPINSTNTSCDDCSIGYCCNMSPCCVTTPSPHYLQTPPQATFPSTSAAPPYSNSESYTNSFPFTTVDEPEFVSIDDEKVKQYLIRLGQQQLQKPQQQQQQKHHYQYQTNCFQKEPKITRVFSAPTPDDIAKPIVYEIIELDDEDEREKLKQIKQQAERSLANKKLPPNLSINFATRQTKSLDISLIPKTPANTILKSNQKNNSRDSIRELQKNHTVVAEIDLLDSDDDDPYMNEDDDGNDEDNDDDDDTLPLAAVSCELKCDDEEDDACNNILASHSRNQSYGTNYVNTQPHRATMKYSKPLVDDVIIVGTHENKNADDMMARWEEYEGQKERVFFECFLCGKKVQSSYNLRRHMMIHTGERPFGCDLCDRRFREFSDMKKHRRRHSNEQNYLCMICHKRAPLDNDPTRCINCCTQSKNAVIMAAMKPATEADIAAEKNSHTRTRNSAEMTLHSTTQQQLQTLPTIASVTSYNISAIGAKPPIKAASPADNSNNNSNNTNTKVSENTLCFLNNLPAVHRPGYNQLGIITRKEFPCPLCNRAFGTRHNLKRHYMIHTGEKPFSCTKCRKPFREYSTLKKHMVTHMRERWYKCMRCPMKFRDFLKYTEHKESHGNDSDSEDQPLIIGSSLTDTKYSSLHVNNYMDSNDEDSGAEDWLECCECGERFNEIDAYNEHLNVHDKNKQIFQCYMCKRQLKSRLELDQHIKQKHKLNITDSMDEDDDDKEDSAIA